METHLLNPFQLRHQGLTVNETPLHQLPTAERLPASHSIVSTDPSLHIPLQLSGVMSGFTVRKPTWDEVCNLNHPTVTQVHMTTSAQWEPHNLDHSQLEGTLRSDLDRAIDPRHLSRIRVRGQVDATQ